MEVVSPYDESKLLHLSKVSVKNSHGTWEAWPGLSVSSKVAGKNWKCASRRWKPW